MSVDVIRNYAAAFAWNRCSYRNTYRQLNYFLLTLLEFSLIKAGFEITICMPLKPGRFVVVVRAGFGLLIGFLSLGILIV